MFVPEPPIEQDVTDMIGIVGDIADEHGWEYTCDVRHRAVIERERARCTYLVTVEDDGEGLHFRCLYDFAIPDFAELEILRLLNLLNNRMEFTRIAGNFSHETGIDQLIYRFSVDYSDERPITMRDIEALIDVAVLIMDRFYLAFQALAATSAGEANQKPDLTAAEAFAMVFSSNTGRA